MYFIKKKKFNFQLFLIFYLFVKFFMIYSFNI